MPVVSAVDPAYRLPNPVSRLPGHDNGIVIDLPSPLGGGSTQVVGTLTFGVGTAADDRFEASRILRLDASGHFTTVFDGRTFPASFIDSGTETLILDADGLGDEEALLLRHLAHARAAAECSGDCVQPCSITTSGIARPEALLGT